MSTNFRNIFGTIVHDIPEGLSPIEFRNLYGTLVHNIPQGVSPIEFRNLYGTLSHSEPSISGSLSDITGTVNISASFDGTGLGYSTSSANFQWSWQSIPAGSSIINQSVALPDGGATTYFDMTDNEGLWHFEGNADDASGNGNNGSIVGSPATVAGKIGQCFLFNGSSDFVFVPNNPSLNSNIGTVALWVKFTSTTNFMSIISKNDVSVSRNGWHLYIDSSELKAQIKDGSGSTTLESNTAINDGQWHSLALVFEAAGISRLYLDGQEVDSDNSTVNFTVSSQNLRIAKNADAFWNEFDGSIDEAALWSRKLSALEINNLYFLQSGSMATDLAGNTGLSDIFTFVPDVSGTFTTNLSITDGLSSINGNVNALISAAGPTPPGPTPIITGSSPTVNLIEANTTGYVINTYAINLLSVQRSREPEQVPFKLGTKGRQSLRLSTNTEFTGSS